ncbi:MAG: hypothetical protein K2P84_04355 [Undibacterium sp.]|nr:hypothetical protein [Undibacterium sp.]
MRISFFISVCLVASMTACGGGGQPAQSNNSTTVAVPSSPPLSIYVGIWQNLCQFHQQDTVIISMPNTSTGNLEVQLQTDYYDGTACTGQVVGVQATSTNLSISYVKTIDTFVALNPSGGASALRVDQITASAPAQFSTISGSKVQRRTLNGKQQWCMSFSNGDSTCVDDSGTQPAQTSQGGMYTRSNELYLLSSSTGGYSVDEKFTRK